MKQLPWWLLDHFLKIFIHWNPFHFTKTFSYLKWLLFASFILSSCQMMNGKNDDQIDSLKIIHRKPDHDNIRGKINEYQGKWKPKEHLLIKFSAKGFLLISIIVKSFVENFLDVSGIHGVSYLHSRNHWVGRLYWVSPRQIWSKFFQYN